MIMYVKIDAIYMFQSNVFEILFSPWTGLKFSEKYVGMWIYLFEILWSRTSNAHLCPK